MRNLPGVFLSSRLPRLSRAQGFFGHFSRDHPTRSRNMNQWRNNEVFITPFLLILKKNSLFHLIIPPKRTLGTLSKDVFEPRTSTGSEAFSLFICLDTNKLVLLSFFSLLKTIYPRVSTKSFPSDAKSPLPVDVRRSKTLLLKLPIIS